MDEFLLQIFGHNSFDTGTERICEKVIGCKPFDKLHNEGCCLPVSL